MKIGVISDTHDQLERVEKAFGIFLENKVNLIIHCGDWVSPFVPKFIYKKFPDFSIPIKTVFGNNEGDHFRFIERKNAENWNIEFYKDSFELDIESKKIAVYHGASEIITQALISCKKYNAVFTGHTHIAVNKNINGVLHLNPGGFTYWDHGNTKYNPSFAIYNSEKNSAEIITL